MPMSDIEQTHSELQAARSGQLASPSLLYQYEHVMIHPSTPRQQEGISTHNMAGRTGYIKTIHRVSFGEDSPELRVTDWNYEVYVNGMCRAIIPIVRGHEDHCEAFCTQLIRRIQDEETPVFIDEESE